LKRNTIEEGQALLEVETDKVVLEIPANCAGTVGELFISEGESVSPGVRLLSLQTPADTGNGENEYPLNPRDLKNLKLKQSSIPYYCLTPISQEH
jgi:pyruvate/2-oxoglutarate dehydrogenase complex dihydrolipoamide acyltransferase (E2) component